MLNSIAIVNRIAVIFLNMVSSLFHQYFRVSRFPSG